MRKNFKYLLGLLFFVSVAYATADRVTKTYLLEFNEASPGANKISIIPPSLGSDYQLTLPTAVGTSGQVLATDASGALSWATASMASGAFVQGGNSFGATGVLGTNDTFGLDFETDNVTRLSLGASGGFTHTLPDLTRGLFQLGTAIGASGDVSIVRGASGITPLDAAAFNVHVTTSNATARAVHAGEFATFPKNVAATTTRYSGILAAALFDNTANLTNTESGLAGLSAAAGAIGTAAAATISNASGLAAVVRNTSSNHVITNAFGMKTSIDPTVVNTAAGITNYFGYYHRDMSGTSTFDGAAVSGIPAAGLRWSSYLNDPSNNYMNGSLLLGQISTTNRLLNLASTTSGAKLHMHDGAAAINAKFTNSTTGSANTDGLDIGINSSAVGEIRQHENLGLNILTNDTNAVQIAAAGTLTFNAYGAGILHSSAGGAITSSAVNLASADVTGTLPVANGGTGTATMTSGALIVGNGTAAYGPLAVGISGTVVLSNGTNWYAGAVTGTGDVVGPASSISGALPLFNGTTGKLLQQSTGTGVVSLAAGVVSTLAPWYVNVNIAGANPNLGLVAITAYTEIIDAGLTATPISGSAAVGIMCSTTNAATAPSTSPTVCAAGSESVGINFALPEAGVFKVCAQFAHLAAGDTDESVISTFQLIETPTNAQTLTLEGGSKISSGLSTMTIATGADNESYNPHTSCSIFNWTAGTKGVRLMYEQSVEGTPDTSRVLADANSSNGQRDILFTVERAGR